MAEPVKSPTPTTTSQVATGAKPAKQVRKRPVNKLADVQIEEFEIDCAGDKELSIQRRTVTKGAAKNNEYFAPAIEGMTPQEFVELFDPVILMNWIGRHIRAFCSVLTREAVEYAGEDEQKMVEKYSELFLKLSPVGDTHRALVLRLKELLDRFNDVDTDTEEGQAQALAMFKEAKQIKLAIAEKKVSQESEDATAAEAAKAKDQPMKAVAA